MKRKQFLHSLKSRYAAVSLLLLFLILTSTMAGYQIVSSSQETATNNETYRSSMLDISRMLRNSIWNNREILEEFLLEPETSGLFQIAKLELQNSRELIAKLNHNLNEQHHDLSKQYYDLDNTLQLLHNDIDELSQQTDILLTTRLDAAKQYPGFAIARDRLLPAQTIFYSAIEIALQEIIEDDQEGYKTEVYQTLEKSRVLVSKLISNFRIYLANRIASFDVDSLDHQEGDNDLIIDQIETTLKQLLLFEEKGELGFQGSEAIVAINKSFFDWKNGYLKIVEIHHNDAWRSDKVILDRNIEPLYLNIWQNIQIFENKFNEFAQQDIDNLQGISNVQLRIIIGICVISILIIILGYYYLERSILRPISMLTDALKDEQQDNRLELLTSPNAEETENLLQAFTAMQQEIRLREDDLRHQAMHDSLTGLPNRNLMQERLRHAVAVARRNKNRPAILLLDLDGFKQVNDTLGHQTGDELLIAIGKRLIKLLRESDTIVRLGGDEFAVIIDDISEKDAVLVATKILNVIQKPFKIEGNQIHISSSIGIAHYPSHGDTDILLIQHADVAMYHAKRNKLGIFVYDHNIGENIIEKQSLVADLRKALSDNSLQLYFQPKVSISSKRTTGLEALLRWEHPDKGFIPPDYIISLAEQSGLINDVFEWVFNQSCLFAKQWQQENFDVNIAVNLSVYDLQHNNIVESVRKHISFHQIPASRFTLEVTESAMMENPQQAIEKLIEVDKMGFKVSVDDYGTGYSSLSYLTKLPVDELKIDKSFVMKMDENENDAIIVRSTIDLAHNLGLKVVAEGVENQEILEILTLFGCDVAQGFYLSRPMPGDQVAQWMEENDNNIVQFFSPASQTVKSAL